MALSIAQSQTKFLADLDQFGESKNVPGVKVDAMEQALLELAIEFKVLCEKYLDEANAISSGKLAESIQFDSVEFDAGVYSVAIKMLYYWKFVNKGVRGVNGGGSGSPYSFKNLHVSRKMMLAIRTWIEREGMKTRTKPAKRRPIRAEKKGARFADAQKTDALAYAVATSIKKHGIKKTGFFDKAISQTKKDMAKKTGLGFQVAIIKEIIGTK